MTTERFHPIGTRIGYITIQIAVHGTARKGNCGMGSAFVMISMKKACTARYFDMDTGEIGNLSQPGPLGPEVCDGEEIADFEMLANHCRPLCTDGPVDPNLQVYCDFDCADDCGGFALPGEDRKSVV